MRIGPHRRGRTAAKWGCRADADDASRRRRETDDILSSWCEKREIARVPAPRRDREGMSGRSTPATCNPHQSAQNDTSPATPVITRTPLKHSRAPYTHAHAVAVTGRTVSRMQCWHTCEVVRGWFWMTPRGSVDDSLTQRFTSSSCRRPTHARQSGHSRQPRGRARSRPPYSLEPPARSRTERACAAS